MTTRALTNGLLAIVICAAAALPAAAQTGSTRTSSASGTPAMDISAGYSYLREQGTGGQPANIYDKGWVAAFAARIGHSRLSVVGEVGANYRSDGFGANQSLYGFLGGVRVPLLRVSRFRIFAQALVGEEYFKQPGFSEKGVAFQPGGGVDVPLSGKLGLRVQGDYRIAHEEGINFKEVRLTAGVVIGIR